MNIIFRCSGEQNCSIPVTNEIFGNPCPGTPKYIEAHYICDLPGKFDVPCIKLLFLTRFKYITYNIAEMREHWLFAKELLLNFFFLDNP